ncbi:MAG: ABC transporter permease [Oscillospiraceae bacterium]|nr:ABC transporter permease [Oscillospiraceae bacterium]
MSEHEDRRDELTPSQEEQQYSLNDDRRVKTLSPGALVVKRFFRNRLAMVGLGILVVMFLFSFVGGWISPYDENQQFYTYEYQSKQYAGVVQNDDFRYASADGQEFGTTAQAYFLLNYNGTGGSEDFSFEYGGIAYDVVCEGTDFFSVYSDGTLLAMAYKDIVNEDGATLSFDVKYGALKAYSNGEDSFEAEGATYTVDEDGNIMLDGEVLGYISRFLVTATENGVTLARTFKEELQECIENDETEFVYTDADGETHTYDVSYEAFTDSWTVNQETETYVYDSYAYPSAAHWLGTDRNGMDMMTRLMYGGRVSLIIGFIVVLIAGVLGIVLGGISGYFGGWVDNLIMRIVDVFYCIPSTPLMIILGAAMDAMNVDAQIRMLFLMLLLGFLSWPSIARLVRGQILSLREQEFMMATEACGVRTSRRIFRHLIPNVMPQLIVSCTMMLGSTILTEATLSFLGLGVKFPFASWGNIINDVNSSYVMTNYWFIWIPAGFCLVATVLGFNFVGDGLRDAFDPKMKR